jgi:antitoxin component YwqK of YwqJK toxin-antitoxin module
MGKFNGNFKEYYENGNIKEDVNYIFAQLNGACKYYHQDGTIERIENYRCNIEHGDFIYFDP